MIRAFLLFLVGLLMLISVGRADTDVGTAQVRKVPAINGGATVEGSVHMMSGGAVTLNGGAVITHDLLVPGTPVVRTDGQPVYGGTLDGSGSVEPSNYQITLHGQATLGHVIRRTNAVALPSVAAPAQPSGTRSVVLDSSSQSAGDWATLRNLTLNGNVGQITVPAGTFGDFTANGGSGFTFGVAGANQPSIYHFQSFNLNGQSEIRVLGPVVINLANGLAANGALGSADHPEWLALNISSGGLTLNGGCTVHGFVNASSTSGTVIINGNSTLTGGLIADRLIINGGGLLRLRQGGGGSANTAPVAANQDLTVAEDTTLAITLSVTDTENDSLTYAIITPPAHGSLSGTAPALIYTPSANYHGPDAFTFRARDASLDSNFATIVLTVTPVNDIPVAAPLNIRTDEDIAVALTLAGTDTDGDTLAYEIVSEPTRGSLEGIPPALTYKPAPNTHGFDSFTYVVRDAVGSSAPVAVSIDITPLNDRPIALPQSLAVAEGETLRITLAATDADGDELAYVITTPPLLGTLVLAADSSAASPAYLYTPPANTDGTATFSFTASDAQLTSVPATIGITITNRNDSPAASPAHAELDEDTSVLISLVATDADGDALTYAVATPPSRGTVTIAGNLATYTAASNAHGADTFTFTASDGSLGSAPAAVNLTIRPINDAPVATPPTGLLTPEDTALAVVLAGTDADDDALTYAITTPPAHGSLVLDAGTSNHYTYTPSADYNGPDSFAYTVSDGTVTSGAATVPIQITPINDAPDAKSAAYAVSEGQTLPLVLVATDTDGDPLTYAVTTMPSLGTLTGTPPELSYVPPANTDVTVTFVFTASDGIAPPASATVTIDVRNVPEAPVAQAQTLALAEDTPINVTLAATDPEGDALTYELVAPPAHGTLTGTAPSLTYTPAANFHGADNLTFIARDASLASAPAVVAFTVTPVNDAPVAPEQSLTTSEDTPLEVTLTATDADGDALLYTLTTPPAHGTLTLMAGTSNRYTYVPAADYHGADSVGFTVNDGIAPVVPSSIRIEITPVNDAPVALAQTQVTPEDTSLTLTLTATDPEGDLLTYAIVTPPAHGTLSGTAPALTYTPTANYAGSDAFAFTVNDGQLTSSPATVSVAITPANDAPTTADQSLALIEDQSGTLVLQAADADGDVLAFSLAATSGNIVTAWNTIALDAVRQATRPVSLGGGGQAPPEISRALAIVHLAVFEAVNAVERVYAPYAAPYLETGGPVALDAAAARAAHDTLYALFPASRPLFASRLAQDLAAVSDSSLRERGSALGAAAAVRILALRASDGAFASSDYAPRPAGTIGAWQPADVALWGTANGGALRPEWGSVTPFVLASPDQFAPPPPPAVGTPAYAAALAEVKALGASTSPVRTPDQTETAYYWADGPGTYSPPGHWNLIATRVAARSDLSAVATARLLALVNLANADVAIACWRSKFVHDLWRPVTAIRHPDDGSPFTESDPVWSPLLGTPQFPAYVSGHSAFSSASATVLAAILGDAVRVTVPSEDPRAATRVLHSLSAAAHEAGRSRVLGGIHYEFDNVAGRELGRDIANHVLAQALVPLATEAPSSIQRGEAVLDGATLTYTPPAHYHGTDTVPFTVTDGLASAAARVSVTLSPVNDLPVAQPQAVSLIEDSSTELTLSATDADGDILAYMVVTPPAHGTLTGVAPALTYVPAPDYSGPDEFTFIASDASGPSAPAVVQFTVLSVNDAPLATPQTVSTPHYTPLTITLAGTDADGDVLSYTLGTIPEHGTLEPVTGGYVYRPRYAFWGQDSFTFTATDGALTSTLATISITITPPSVAVTPIISLAPITPAPLPDTAFSLRATALDADGSVVRVEFYEGAALLGTLTRDEPGEPGIYALLLSSGRPAGTYTFTAKVYDDQGLFAVSAPLSVTLATDPRARTFTTTADFEEGQIRTLNSEGDQLTTSFFPSAYDFVWVVNSSKGTIVRLDSETARVVGEFRAGPDGSSGFPSRISIDSRGNAFVANRQTGVIVKIGLGADNGTWIDRNDNGEIDTSTGLNDVRSWPAGGSPTDEQILLTIETGLSGLEHMAIDSDDNIWVGPYSGVWKLYDGETGELLRTEAGAPGLGGRGGFVDEDGIQVSAGPRFLHWDTARPLIDSADASFAANVRRNAWGVTKDFDGNFWVTEDWQSTIHKHSPDGTLLGSFYHGEPWAQGVTTGIDGHIWVAHSHCGYTVGHLLPDGTFLGNVLVANHGPTEVAADRKGRIWVVSTTGVVERINPLGGPLGKDGLTPVGEVDVRSPNLGGTLWTFGNFVGNRSGLFLQDGQWRFAYDGQVAGSAWGPVQWNAFLYNDATMLVEVALSDDGVNFGPWQSLTLESPVPAGAGRHLRGRVTFTPATTGESPTLYDLTVGTQGYPAPEPPRYWRVSAGDDIDASWPDTIQLKGAFGRSAHVFLTQPTYQWSLVSFTPLPAGTVGTAPAGGVPTFSDPTDPRATVTFDGVGDYVLRVTATLDGVVSTDDVHLHVTPFNKTPFVSAGEHVFLRNASDLATLTGTARDDGLPLPAKLTLKWEKLFGPGDVTFTDPAAAATGALFTKAGIYVLRLTGSDGEFSHSSTVTAWVGMVCRPSTPAGLVSWWQGNADGADHVGGNQAFPENGANFAEGQVGPAFNFDGLNDRLLMFGNPSLDVGQGSGFSFEFWARPTESREATLFQYGRNSTTYGLTIRQSGTNLIANYREPSGLNHEVSIGSALPVNTWTHLAITYDRTSGLAAIYRNGGYSGSWSIGKITVDTLNDLRVGSSWSNNNHFKGQLDEISLYDRALGSAEAWQIYTAGTAGKRPPTSNTAPVVVAGPASGYALVGATRSLALAGSVIDDELPHGLGLNTRWSVLNAPVVVASPLTYATVSFDDASSPTAVATFSAPGIYTLRLYSEDGATCSEDAVEVRVAVDTSAETPAGLVAWWQGNYTTEEHVTGRTEAAVNIAYATGKVGGDFNFDAGNRRVLVQTPEQTNIGSFANGFTIEFWVDPALNDNLPRRVLAWSNGTAEKLRVESYGRSDYGQLRLHNGTTYWDIPSVHESSGWVHAAYVYDRTANRLRLYRNGTLQSDVAVAADAFATIASGEFYLGGLPYQGGNEWFSGGLDEVAFYNRPLTGSEVANIYSAGASGKLPLTDNQAPVVTAGPDRALNSTSGTVTLLGQASDDGLPAGALAVQWTQLFGPATATITSPTQAQTAVTLPQAGLYGFQLAGSDGFITRRDLAEVRVASTTSVETPAGLVAWWQGNYTTEEHVTGRTEAAVNIAYATGKVGGDFNFDAGNRRVLVQAPEQTNIGSFTNGFTIEFWVDPALNDNLPRRVLAWSNGTAEKLRVESYGRSDYGQLRLHNGTTYWDIPSVHESSGWVHAAYVYDRMANRLRLYRNGTLQSDVAVAVDVFASVASGEFYLGGLPYQGGNEWFSGGLDEVAFYNRPLTGSEVANIYSAGASGKLPLTDNQAPVVTAGPDRALNSTSGTVTLLGQASDDGLPAGSLAVQWTQLFGPATATLASPTQAQTAVTLPQAGLYGFQLAGSDGFITRRDVAEVRVASTTSVETPAGLVAWWQGNYTTEEHVTGRTEAAVNIAYATGKVGGDFNFDAGNRRVLVQAPEQTNIGSFANGFTIEFWVDPALNDNLPRRVLAWSNGTAEKLRIESYGRSDYGQLRLQTGSSSWDIPSVHYSSGWVHAAYVYDRAANRLRLYRNGTLQSDVAVAADAFATVASGEFYLGGLPYQGGNEWFSGGLDEVSFYNRPLTGSEVANIYSAGASGKLPLTNDQPPQVQLIAPYDGTELLTGSPLTLTALAIDREGAVASVAFYNGTTLIGTAIAPETTSSSTFSFNLGAGLSIGTHVLTAVATDAGGVSTTSAPATVTVTYGPPSVALLEPADGATINALLPLTLTASASYAGGPIALVEFFDGVTKLGESTAPEPASGDYRLSISAGLAPGSHSLTVKATAADGASRTSTPVTITAETLYPTVAITAPTGGARLISNSAVTLEAVATVSTGSIARVEFYQGATLLGTVTAPIDGSTGLYRLVLPSGFPAGSHTLTARAVTTVGASTDSSPITITVETIYPVVAITAPTDGAQLIADSPVTLDATAAVSTGSIARVEFYRGVTLLGTVTAPVTGSPGLYRLVLSSGFPAGSHSLTARAVTAVGASTDSAQITVTAAPYTGPDTVELSSPLDSARISAPTSITGVIAVQGLASWKVEYRLTPAEGVSDASAPWTTLNTGTGHIGIPKTDSQASAPGELGTFDPTLLLNGLYELRLAATTTTGMTTIIPAISVLVEGNMKVGAFSIAFNDLVESTPGLPITLTRTYDSRDRRAGDFGPGWHLALGNIRVQKSTSLAHGWEQLMEGEELSTAYYIDPQRKHIVSIVLPDGEAHRFEAGIYIPKTSGIGLPDNYQWLIPISEGQLVFKPIGDTTSTLTIDEDNTFFFSGMIGEEYLTKGFPGIDDAHEPTRFRLTTADGTVMILDQALGLLELQDKSGNVLVIHRRASDGRIESIDSIQNGETGPITRTVEIDRLADGRVDHITDLAGRTLDYLYDPQGRLASFTDRENNTTQFRYELSDVPTHSRFSYLTKIIDPRGLPAVRSEYDDDGRLKKQIDADGKETVFDRGIAAFGRFEKITDRLGHATTFFYDDRGNVTTKVDALGATTTYDYYPDSDRVKFEEDHYHNVKAFAYDARGNVTTEILGASRSEDPATATIGHITRTTYTSFSAPLSIADPDGRVQSFSYDPDTQQLLTHTVGQLAPTASSEIIAATPATTTYTYHTDGTLWTVTDALGNVTTTTYDYGWTDPAYPGAVKRVTTTVIDPAGTPGSDPTNATATTLRTTYSYSDAQDNLLVTVTPRTLTDGSVESVPTRHVYDAENRLRFTVLPDGRIQETRYTSFGQTDKTIEWPVGTDLAALIAAGSSGPTTGARVTSMTYDVRGNVERTTLPDGTYTATGRDLEGRTVWSQDARGYRTFTAYDEVGRPRFTIHPDADDGTFEAAPTAADDPRLANNPRSETRYDLVGRVRFQVDERGATTETRYFADGTPNAERREKLVQHLDGEELVTTYDYYPSGQVHAVTDPRGNTTGTRYDSHGRPVRMLLPATDEHPATETLTTYNPLGQRVATTDQAGKVTRHRYDALGRLVEVRQYLDQSLAASDVGFTQAATATGIVSTTYAYDEAGNQIAQTDARAHVTRYKHDSLGRRLKRILPDLAEENLDYDTWGRLWHRKDFAGKTTTYGYDVLNRLKSKAADATHPSLVYAHAIARVEYDYDASGAREAARTYNASGTLLYTESTPRDERGHVDYKDTGATRLDYEYYANGQLQDVVSSNPDGVNIGYRYDGLNRLAYVDDATKSLPVRTTSYTYNPNGSLESVTYSNGVSHTYGYDALNRLRSLDVAAGLGATLHAYDYKLTISGHRHHVIEGAKTTTYGYDELYRLTGETITGGPSGQNGTIGYGLDKVGNRLNRTSTIAEITEQLSRTYNSRDQLAGDVYDLNGNTSSGRLSPLAPGLAPETSGTDVYDFEGRLIVRTKPDGSTINLGYDADGLRTQKTILNSGAQLVSVTHYLLDTNNLTGYAQVVEERTTDANDTALKTYTYGSDLISETTHSSLPATRYFSYDGGGSVRELTDETGAITDRYTYDAFGVLIVRIGTSDNTYLYRGEQWDADLGLYYLRARFMNPDSGRFWNQDTYEGSNTDPASLHKYNYGSSNPVMFMDPSGHFSMAEIQMAVQSVGILARMAIPTIARIGFTVAQRLAAAALRPLFVFAGGLPIATQMGQRLSVFDRFQRFFITPTQGYAPVAPWLKDMFQMMGVRLQQGHVFIQQAWYRAGSPNQWYPGDTAANLGMQRLANAGFNLLAMPDGLNRAMGANNLQGSIGTTVFAGGVVTGTASSIAWALDNLWELITGPESDEVPPPATP